ncbi:hypothetical protein, partial [Leptodesmis sp.]|uniref:hypothetical protein n=1 Tax=Leptodesmis sp. TaxID=3100501 RepID=UPI0040535435
QTPPLSRQNTPKPATPASPDKQTPPLSRQNTPKPATPASLGMKKVNTKGIVEVRTKATRGIEFSELNYDAGILVGSVRNRTGKAIGRVTINYTTYLRESDTKWKLIYSGSTTTEASQLQAGEKSSFTAIPLRKGDKAVITKVEF